MTHYHLHIGASTLPRRSREPLTLGQAMHRAYGHQYAVIYRILGGRPVPIVADAGSDEVIIMPTARRVHREAIEWNMIASDIERWLENVR